MATVRNLFTGTADTNNQTAYTSPAFTPVAGEVLIIFAPATGTNAAAPTLTGSANSMTFTLLSAQPRKATGLVDKFYAFISNQVVPASPVSMTVTVTYTGDPATGVIWSGAGISGLASAGTAAIRTGQQVGAEGAGGTAVSATFPVSCLTTNPTILAHFITVGTGATYPAGWTERADAVLATPVGGGGYGSRDSGFTGTTIATTNTNMGTWAGVVYEFEAASAGPINRGAADTVTVSDALARAGTLPRPAADTVTTSDAAARALALPRAATDVVTVSDSTSATVVRLLPRSTTDTVTVSDASARSALTLARAAAESSPAADTVARSSSRGRATAEAVTVSDTLARAIPQARATTETVTVSDTLTRSGARARTTADVVTVSDATAKAFARVRTTTETVTVSDTAVRGAATRARSVADSVTVSDVTSGSTSGQLARNTAETVTIADTAARTTSRSRSTTDTAGASDVASGRRGYARALGDVVTVADLSARATAYARAVLETVTVADAVTGLYVPPGGTGPAPPRRTLYVRRETRAWRVSPSIRLIVAIPQGRMFHVNPATRTLRVPAPERSLAP